MDQTRRISVSLALIALVCFFLPWVQVSCGGAKDSATGLDLARDGANSLWLIPAFMVVIILFAVRVIPIKQAVFGLLTLLSGLINLYLMNHQRLKFEDTSGLVTARLTGWFWLGLLSSIGLSAFGALGILRRSRSP